MTDRMKRLSQKKEERNRRSIINEEYEYSEASSNNIDRDGLTQYSSPNKHDNTYISQKQAMNNSTMAQSEPIDFYGG